VHGAEREARRRWLAHRPTAVIVVRKTDPVSWLDLAAAWPVPARFDPRDALSPRESAFWSLSDELAVGLTPLADTSADPSGAIGAPLLAVDEGAWIMEGFVAGWCGDRERVSFAQAFHRAASRMERALADGARTDDAGTQTGPVSGLESSRPSAEP